MSQRGYLYADGAGYIEIADGTSDNWGEGMAVGTPFLILDRDVLTDPLEELERKLFWWVVDECNVQGPVSDGEIALARDAGYQVEKGALETRYGCSYWWTFCDGGDVEASDGDWDHEGEAWADAVRAWKEDTNAINPDPMAPGAN